MTTTPRQQARKSIRDRLISAYAAGGCNEVVRVHDSLADGEHEYARDWLATYERGTWQSRALGAIERSAFTD